MEVMLGASVAALVYLAFAFDVLGFLARDELWLRTLMLIGSAFYIAYYYFVADTPLWDAMLTNGALAAVNFLMICVVISERTTFAMSADNQSLYRMFPLLTPGQFRRLRRVAERIEATAPTELVRQGRRPEHLYFVIDGPVEIEKGGSLSRIPSRVFIGEVAFLTGRTASATVWVEPGASYLQWRTSDLERLSRRSPQLRVALLGHLNMDMATKVANSQPMPQS